MDYELKPREIRDSVGIVKTYPVGVRTVNGTITETVRAFQPEPPPSLKGMFDRARPNIPMRKTIYHKVDGAALMYTVDADKAVKQFPNEWSADPWPGQQPSVPTQAA